MWLLLCGLLTACFLQYVSEQTRQVIKVAYIVNVVFSTRNLLQLPSKVFIPPNTDNNNADISSLQNVDTINPLFRKTEKINASIKIILFVDYKFSQQPQWNYELGFNILICLHVPLYFKPFLKNLAVEIKINATYQFNTN